MQVQTNKVRQNIIDCIFYTQTLPEIKDQTNITSWHFVAKTNIDLYLN